MYNQTKRYNVLLAGLLLIMLFLVACGGSEPAAEPTEAPAATEAPAEEEAAPTEAPAEEAAVEEEAPAEEGAAVALPEVDVLAISGDIVVAGSSTVYPLTEAMAERFTDEGYADQITIDSIGSGAGFERFCVNAESDISNASRPIKDEEVAACQENGREPLEFRVGTDALAVTVSQENDFIDNLTFEELANIFSGEAATWADVNADWPAEEIQLYSPGTDSGTFDYFVEEVFEEDSEPILSATNIQFSEDDNVLVQGIQGSPYAIGFFGYAYYQENADILKILNVEGVEPNAETAESNEYPLSRPLFVYSAPSIMVEKPQVADFINFYLSFVNEEIGQVGYFPASNASIDASKAMWMDAQDGEVAMEAPVMEEEPAEEAPAEEGAAVALPEVDVLAISGDIVVAGSSTVYPLTEAMTERFTDEGYADQITIDSIGSGAGFERFCVNAESDISNASRPIKDEEVAACQENGREPLEFRVGTDALAVTVSQENDFIDNLTFEELAAVFSGQAATWADVNADWPAEEIKLYSPGTDSGTFDYFVEEVFEKDSEPILSATNIQFSEDDNVLVQGIQGSPYAIGFFGYAYYQENADILKILNVEGVEPNAETAESNEYPLSRPLFIYSAPTVLQEKAQVADFINFYLTFVNEEITEVGYFPASDSALNNARQLLLDAMK